MTAHNPMCDREAKTRALSPRDVGALPLGSKRDMRSNRLSKLKFVRLKLVRCVVVQHEFPDQSAVSQQWNEGNCPNTFFGMSSPAS